MNRHYAIHQAIDGLCDAIRRSDPSAIDYWQSQLRRLTVGR